MQDLLVSAVDWKNGSDFIFLKTAMGTFIDFFFLNFTAVN